MRLLANLFVGAWFFVFIAGASLVVLGFFCGKFMLLVGLGLFLPALCLRDYVKELIKEINA